MKKVINFLLNNPAFAHRIISYHYPFSYSDLFELKDYLDWRFVSSNQQIEFTDEVINSFEDYWSIPELINNPKIAWNSSNIKMLFGKKLKEKSSGINIKNIIRENFKIFYLIIIENPFSWDENEIKEFIGERKVFSDIDYLNQYNKIFSSFSDFRPKNKWDINSLSFIVNKTPIVLNWEKLSSSNNIEWSPELIEKFADYWDWDSLSDNGSLPWNYKLLIKFADKWNWQLVHIVRPDYIQRIYNGVIKKKLSADFALIVCNSNVNWDNKTLLEIVVSVNFQNPKLKKHYFKSIELNLPELEYYFYSNLIRNEYVTKSIEDCINYKDKYYWNSLIYNKKIKWSLETLEELQDVLDNYDWLELCKQPHITWNFAMLNRYKDNINWESIFKYGKFSINISQIKRLLNTLSENQKINLDIIIDFLNNKYIAIDVSIIQLLQKLLPEEQPNWFWLEEYNNINSLLDFNRVNKFLFKNLDSKDIEVILEKVSKFKLEPIYKIDDDFEPDFNGDDKRELADILGYDGDDVDDISSDDIWERTGH